MESVEIQPRWSFWCLLCLSQEVRSFSNTAHKNLFLSSCLFSGYFLQNFMQVNNVLFFKKNLCLICPLSLRVWAAYLPPCGVAGGWRTWCQASQLALAGKHSKLYSEKSEYRQHKMYSVKDRQTLFTARLVKTGMKSYWGNLKHYWRIFKKRFTVVTVQ